MQLHVAAGFDKIMKRVLLDAGWFHSRYTVCIEGPGTFSFTKVVTQYSSF
jgi:hypothetical protein